jgi:hypothetical protein
MTEAGPIPTVLTDSSGAASKALSDLERLLRGTADAHLHYADTEGGWTVAQVVSHICLCGLLWIADLERVRHHGDMLVIREELGHDAVGPAPHSAAEAARRLASVRVALESCLPAADPAVLTRSVEVTTLGTRTVADWFPVIIGHLEAHCEQARAILRARGALAS